MYINHENCAPLGYYATSIGNPLPMFWDNLSVPFSRVILEKGPIAFPGTSVTNYHYSLRNSPVRRGSHLCGSHLRDSHLRGSHLRGSHLLRGGSPKSHV